MRIDNFFIYRTRAIISCSLYNFTPFPKIISLGGFFQKILSLYMACIQERLMMACVRYLKFSSIWESRYVFVLKNFIIGINSKFCIYANKLSIRKGFYKFAETGSRKMFLSWLLIQSEKMEIKNGSLKKIYPAFFILE